MKIKRLIATVLAACTVLSSFAINASAIGTKEEKDELVNLALGKKYSYSYPGVDAVKGDPSGKVLTDGRLVSGEPGSDGWSMFKILNEQFHWPSNLKDYKGNTIYEDFKAFDKAQSSYYIKLDMNFIQDIEKVILSTGFGGSAKLLKNIDVFISDDGYNYNTYKKQSFTKEFKDGKMTYSVSFDEGVVKAKGVMVVVYAPADYTIAMDELQVLGKENSTSKLISRGVPYVWNGKDVNPDVDSKMLTDGSYSTFASFHVSKLDEKNVAIKSWNNEVDEYSKLPMQSVTFTYPNEVNLNQVTFDAICNLKGSYSAGKPDRVVVDYSLDGINYENFSETLGNSTTGYSDVFFKQRYIITRPETVRAKYVKVKIFTKANIAIDEIEMYGSDTPVAAPVFNGINRHDFIAQSNIFSGKKYFSDEMLTDNKYRQKTPIRGVKSGDKYTYTFETDLDKYYPEICGSTFTVMDNNITGYKVYLSESGKDYELAGDKYESVKETNMYTFKTYFDKTGADKVKIVIESSAAQVNFAELQLFDEMPQLPLVRGGFFQLTTQAFDSDPIARSSDYYWYLQMKSMKELGMDYVVMQYGGEFLPKSCITDVPESSPLYAKGYRKRLNYGCEDVLTAILNAADKLNMQIYLGTLYGAYGYHGAVDRNMNGTNGYGSGSAEGMQYAKEVGEDAADLIDLLYSKYGTHKSLAGFYYADEACDSWLTSNNQAVPLYRSIYEPQTERVRALNPELKTMISPAIWSESLTESAGDRSGVRLAEMIKATEDGGRPIIDIVSAQDCLGRMSSFKVQDNRYIAYEGNISGWARATESTGAEFWIDAEVFEQTNLTKRYDDCLDSYNISSRYTNGTIVFDIPHYLSGLVKNDQSDYTYFLNEYNLRESNKLYVSSMLKYADELNNQTDNKVKIAGVKNNESVKRNVELRSSTPTATFTVEKNGTAYKNGVGKTITIDEEGTYTAKATRTGYDDSDVITFTIDKTTPLITGVENNKTYTAPVSLKTSEECTYKITKDGKAYFAPEDKAITSNGTYKVIAYDKANNASSEVTFKININYTTDLDPINAKIAECDGLKEEKYTPETWIVFSAKYAELKSYFSDTISQKDADYLLKEITKAASELELNPVTENDIDLPGFTKDGNKFTLDVPETAESQEINVIPNNDDMEYIVSADKYFKNKIEVTDNKFTLNIKNNVVTKFYIMLLNEEASPEVSGEAPTDGNIFEGTINKEYTAPVFTDIRDDHYAKEPVERMKQYGIVNGYYEDDTFKFKPDNFASRSEACTMIIRYLGIDASKYSDVDLSKVYTDYEKIPSWAVDNVKAAYKLGIMGGKESPVNGNLEFCGDQQITRAEFSKIMNIASINSEDYKNKPTFTDIDESHWAYKYIAVLSEEGVINGVGDNKFAPGDNITRGAIIKMMSGTYGKY